MEVVQGGAAVSGPIRRPLATPRETSDIRHYVGIGCQEASVVSRPVMSSS